MEAQIAELDDKNQIFDSARKSDFERWRVAQITPETVRLDHRRLR